MGETVDDHETGTAFIRADAVDLKFFDATLDRIADSIAILGDTRTKNLRRAKAVGILASPQQALDLYATTADQVRNRGDADLPADVPSSIGLDDADTHGAHDPGGNPAAFVRGVTIKVDPRPKAVLYVHLTKESLDTGEGAARVEGIGPVTLDQAKQWLGNCTITLKPVIDVAGIAPVDAYEIPDHIREAVHLITPTDVFPYASNLSREMDLDHTIPYLDPDDGGPPGQTGIGKLGPLTRHHHRIKTHSRWQVKQPFPGIYLWRSPHGRYWLVDHTGTRRLNPDNAA